MATMNAKDAISAKLASCYVTIGNERYLLMQAKNVEVKYEKDKQEVPIWQNHQGQQGQRRKNNGFLYDLSQYGSVYRNAGRLSG